MDQGGCSRMHLLGLVLNNPFYVRVWLVQFVQILDILFFDMKEIQDVEDVSDESETDSFIEQIYLIRTMKLMF